MAAPAANASPISSAGRAPRGLPLPVDDAVTAAAVLEGHIDRPLRPGPGYWLAGADGGVFAYGRAHFSGSAAGAGLQASLSGIAATPSGQGYWMAGRDGGVFAFGDAPFFGGVAGQLGAGRVVAIAGTPSGKGYWLAGSDGGVFAFGDAPFMGGLAGTALNEPITSIASTPSGQGYWLVARDGGVFSFGDAGFFGGAAGTLLNRGVVGITGTPSGQGYWLAGGDGGVFSFGDAGFFGSAIGANPAAPIVGIAPTVSGKGYWLAGSDGGVFAFGDAGYYGGPMEDGVRSRIVGIASGVGTDVRTQATAVSGTFGWDVSWPQCGTRLPDGGYSYAIIGVTDGHQFDTNPCLESEFRWANRHGSLASVYINVNWPSRADEPHLAARMADKCPPTDLPCQAYWWGWRGSEYAMQAAAKNHVSTPMWWLDIETMNRWHTDPRINAFVIKGAKESLEASGLRVGIYSTAYQWKLIAGDYAPGVPNWVATMAPAHEAPRYCQMDKSFGGGTPWIVQYPNVLDGNFLCEAGRGEILKAFRQPPPPAVPEFPAGD
jgi:hypothetical protein